MSNEFDIHGNVHRLLRCLDVVPDVRQAAAFTEQLSNNVAPFVFTQVSAHNAKRKIAEFSPKPEAFLLKYEEMKGRNVRGLDPLIQLLSMVVSTENMATKMAPRLAPVLQLDSSARSSSNIASLANSGRTKLSDSELAKIKENLLRDKDINRLLSSSSIGNLNASYSSETKRQKLKSSIVKKNANLPTLPSWCHEQGFLTHDFVPSSKSAYYMNSSLMSPALSVGSSELRLRPDCQIGSLALNNQEALVCRDLVHLMSGLSGRYVRAKDVSSEIDKREFLIDSSMDTSLVTFVNRFLPMFTNYSLIMRFIDEKSAFEFGQVNHALCGAIRALMKEYLIFVAQVERQLRLGKIQLQKLWFVVQSTMQTLQIIANIITDINKGGYTGGEVLSVLHSYVMNSIKDAKTQDLCNHLALCASRPYFDTLQDWIYKGQIKDPFSEFMVEQKSGEKLDPETVKYCLKESFSCDYWDKYYIHVPKNTPAFLEDLHEVVLNTGKYLNVVRLYGQDFKFPKAREVIYTLQTRSYHEILEQAYSFASKLLLDLLIEKEGLKARLSSVKQYFLMGQGDFYLQFMTSAASELKKPVSEIVPAKLEHLLELSMRTSSANSDVYKDDVKTVLLPCDYVTQLHKILSIETDFENSSSSSGATELNLSGLEAFSVTLDVKWPINLLLNQKAIARYQMLFRHIFYIKNVERLLCSVWVDNKTCIATPGSYTPWHAKMFLLRDKMMGFVKNLELYIMFDVIEPHWHKLQKVLAEVADVELLLRTHSQFLDHCLKECLLTTPDLLSFVSKLLAVCVNFSNAIRRLTRSSKIQREAAAKIGEMSAGSKEERKISATTGVHPSAAEMMIKGPNIDHVLNTFNKNFNQLFRDLLDRLNYYEKREAELSMINVIARLDYNGYYGEMLARAKERKLMKQAAKAAAMSSGLSPF